MCHPTLGSSGSTVSSEDKEQRGPDDQRFSFKVQSLKAGTQSQKSRKEGKVDIFSRTYPLTTSLRGCTERVLPRFQESCREPGCLLPPSCFPGLHAIPALTQDACSLIRGWTTLLALRGSAQEPGEEADGQVCLI